MASGLAASLAHPGGNVTGLTFISSGVAQKYVELLRDAVGSMARIAVLASRLQDPEIQADLEAAARALRIELLPPAIVTRAEDIEAFFARMGREGRGGIVVPNDEFMVFHRRRVVEAAAKHRVPTIYASREYVEAGGLMAYGPSVLDLFRRAPLFVDKILKGARPADLPMEQPVKFELVVNARAVTALGLGLPPSFLARADEVIQ